ncbi:hypothetical protein POX_c04326 [Penicillium oxalicum]|uniref:hypothetical protein n=1 Tax=Penicillium oxalicum TaxID=69781 RepID=UPI0020B8F170|nr:hypothetical protein POX_c04326 [Penicillium oxalicum]KAI2791465.1 hypothetical protein POX_c04326 [Penicillium oxalicum]
MGSVGVFRTWGPTISWASSRVHWLDEWPTIDIYDSWVAEQFKYSETQNEEDSLVESTRKRSTDAREKHPTLNGQRNPTAYLRCTRSAEVKNAGGQDGDVICCVNFPSDV